MNEDPAQCGRGAVRCGGCRDGALPSLVAGRSRPSPADGQARFLRRTGRSGDQGRSSGSAGLAIDGKGNVYSADGDNAVSAWSSPWPGKSSTIAGTGDGISRGYGFSGDGGPANRWTGGRYRGGGGREGQRLYRRYGNYRVQGLALKAILCVITLVALSVTAHGSAASPPRRPMPAAPPRTRLERVR